MRLHTLSLSAVGPFATAQVIDFDRLAAGGLFLFEGPTGVGKSTILDALTFALYGGLATEAGDAARLRSDFADPGQRPEVQLEFSVRGARRRITRSPEFRRPKKRGTGSTTEKASVHLERFAEGTWSTESHAKDEVGVLIGELLGLNRAQFRQVVLLPQGEFATFLRAGDDERREVLGRLFGSDLYQRITRALQGSAQEAGRALQAADSELRDRVAAAAEAAGLSTADHEALASRTLADRLGELGELEGHLGRQLRAAESVAASSQELLEEARGALASAQSTAALVTRRTEAEAARADALGRSDDYAHRRALLAGARRAGPLAPLLDAAEATARAVAHLRDAVAVASHPQVPTAEQLAGVGAAQLADAASRARTEAGQLSHVINVEDRLPDERAALEAAQRTVHRLEHLADAARSRAEVIPGAVEEVRHRLATAQALAAGVAATEQILEAVGPQAQAASRVEAARVAVGELRSAQRVAKRAFDAAADQYTLLVDQRLADVRGELAQRLVAGDPCLVCGSAEHPAPADLSVAGVSAEQVRTAAAERDTARMVLDQAQAALARAEADLDGDIRTAGGRSASQWQSHIAELQDRITAGEAAQRDCVELSAEVSALAAEQVALAAELQDLAGQLAAARAEVAHRDQQLAAHTAEVERARGPEDSARARVDGLITAADRASALAGAVHDLDRGLADAAAATDQAQAAVQSAGFHDVAQARAALLPGEQMDELAADIVEWERAIAQAQATLDSAELRRVAGLDPGQAAARVEAASAELTRREEQVRAAQQECTVASQQARRFAERVAEVRQRAQRRRELASLNEDIVALDQYARGMAGTPRMSLVTFVLRYWFEQVVAAANVRLQSMSAGKYELLRIDEAVRKTDRVGLGLAVLDRHTGRERSPATLSGGETFYTSLALALGLADVVVAQAGGAQLDTLFIDEGFGSLDPDTLDDVMGVIDDLRGNGRVIGIVSHVPELKERIAERLSVRRARPDGPSTISVLV